MMDKKCVAKQDCNKDADDKKNVAIVVKDSSVFKMGECFDSYEDLLKRLAGHSKQSMVHYWRRDSRTVQGAYMKTTRPLEPRLVYYYVKYACVFGGQKFLPRGRGQRQSMSMRTDCPAHIMVRANKTGRQLQVISVCNTHNHPISQELYRSLPQDRKLEPPIKQEVLNMLKLGIENKSVLEYVQHTTGKTLTNKDLFNLGAGDKTKDKTRPTSRVTRKGGSDTNAMTLPDTTEGIEGGDSGEEGASAVEFLHKADSPTLDEFNAQVVDINNKNISYFYSMPNVNEFHMIDSDDLTSVKIVEDIGNVVSSESQILSMDEDDLQDTIQSYQAMSDATAIIDSSNKIKLKLVNIDSENKVLIHQVPDSNENTLLNGVVDPMDQIDLNNIVVVRDNLHDDQQLVQLYKLNDNDLLGIDGKCNVTDSFEDYIAFETGHHDLVDFPNTKSAMVDDTLQTTTTLMLMDESVGDISTNATAVSCDSCGRTDAMMKNDIERLSHEKEKLEREVRQLEMKRDSLKNDIARRESHRDWSYILDSCEGPVQYILVDQ